MLLFRVCFNLAVLQPVVGGGKVMENVFWMESHAEASPLPAPGRCCCSAAWPRLHGGPWVLGRGKHGSRRDLALNPYVKQLLAADAEASGTLINN